MKKHVLIFILAISLSQILLAQQYTPMLDSVNVWTYTGNIMGVLKIAKHTLCNYPLNNATISSREYTLLDTMIAGHIYKSMYSSIGSA